MKTSGKCFVAIEANNGNMYQVLLDENGQALVLNLLQQYFGDKIKAVKGKLPFTLKK